MLDIIILIFLCRIIGKQAIKKGLKPGLWKLYTVLAWLAAEFIGIIIALVIFGVRIENIAYLKDNLTYIMLIGEFSAFGGFLIIKYILEKKPDMLQNDIDSIGVDDLKP